MADKVLLWLIKHLVFLWDRNDDKLAFDFSDSERKDYSIVVSRFYDDYYTVGTAMFPVNKKGEK